MNNRRKNQTWRLLPVSLRISSLLAILFWLATTAPAQGKSLEEEIAVRARPYSAYIAAAASRYGIDPNLLCVIGYLESRFNPAAVSRRGARGMMQFMPATAARYGLANPHHPQSSIDAAARYLRDLAIRFEHRADLMLAGYNAGEGAVEAYRAGRTIIYKRRIINPKGLLTDGIPPFRETRAYVARGIQMLRALRSVSMASAQQVGQETKEKASQKNANKPGRNSVRLSIRAKPPELLSDPSLPLHRQSIRLQSSPELK